MKVLSLITRLNIGGASRQVLLLGRDLSPRFAFTLAAGRPESHEGEMTDPAVRVEPVSLVRPVSPADDLRASVQVRRLISQVEPQILHTHMAKAGAVGRGTAATMRHRPLTVHTFHGHVLEGYFSPRRQQAFLVAERALARRTDALVAVSDEVRTELLALGIGRPEQFQVIELGLELDAFLALDGPGDGGFRKSIGVPVGMPLVAVVGRLVPIKDHPTLLRALAELPGVHLAIVGDGESAADLKGLVEQLGLGDRVHFAGWHLDLVPVLADIDAVALTSRNEGTPVALIEAAAAGRPVVATAVGGVPSVVRDGVSGYLVPPGDPAAVADRLRRLLADPALRASMGAAGRAHVSSRFGAARMIADTEALYDDLLSRRSVRARSG